MDCNAVLRIILFKCSVLLRWINFCVRKILYRLLVYTCKIGWTKYTACNYSTGLQENKNSSWDQAEVCSTEGVFQETEWNFFVKTRHYVDYMYIGQLVVRDLRRISDERLIIVFGRIYWYSFTCRQCCDENVYHVCRYMTRNSSGNLKSGSLKTHSNRNLKIKATYSQPGPCSFVFIPYEICWHLTKHTSNP